MEHHKHIGMMVWSVLLLAFTGCSTDVPVPYQQDIPDWFPQMDVPAENQLTQARIDLGRRLFYEPLLSSDSAISCGSCHHQDKAFTDGVPISLGVNDTVGMRNAPTLANIGFSPYFFWDGGVNTLELQMQQPIFSASEMNFSIAGFLERIKDNEEYRSMFQLAYGREPDAFGISRAIACFERTFISGNSRFDQYEYKGMASALSEQEKRGMELFFSERTNCADCHKPPLFTNHAFENVGLYPDYEDPGRARITHLAQDIGKFKVPTLRNVALTAPYMHNGSVGTLEEVMEHFNSGGTGHAGQNEKIRPLGLSTTEMTELVLFLKTLTDQRFISDPDLQDPDSPL